MTSLADTNLRIDELRQRMVALQKLGYKNHLVMSVYSAAEVKARSRKAQASGFCNALCQVNFSQYDNYDGIDIVEQCCTWCVGGVGGLTLQS